jgi:hypothetical protein
MQFKNPKQTGTDAEEIRHGFEDVVNELKGIKTALQDIALRIPKEKRAAKGKVPF